MNLFAVADQIATRLNVADQIRAVSFPADSVTPPAGGAAAVVSLPDRITFDETYQRGVDRMLLSLLLLVGKASDRAAAKLLSAFCDGSGSLSVKEILESGSYTAFGTLTVTAIDFDVVTVSNIDYLAATFTLDISGSGE